MTDKKVIYSEKGHPLLIINCANFFKASVMQDGNTRYVKAVSYSTIKFNLYVYSINIFEHFNKYFEEYLLCRVIFV
jgi:hypothetical protein